MIQIDRADVLLTTVVDGDVRLNVGDKVDGKGFGARIPYWQTCGFRSRPNPPTSTGAAQVLYLTQGNTRCVVASRDGRFVGPFGSLDEGDCEIISDCDAGLRLDKSANSIRLEADGASVVVDGAAGTVTVTKGTATIVVATVATVDTMTLSVGTSSITITDAGVAILGTTVTVNGVPVP